MPTGPASASRGEPRGTQGDPLRGVPLGSPRLAWALGARRRVPWAFIAGPSYTYSNQVTDPNAPMGRNGVCCHCPAGTDPFCPKGNDPFGEGPRNDTKTVSGLPSASPFGYAPSRAGPPLVVPQCPSPQSTPPRDPERITSGLEGSKALGLQDLCLEGFREWIG